MSLGIILNNKIINPFIKLQQWDSNPQQPQLFLCLKVRCCNVANIQKVRESSTGIIPILMFDTIALDSSIQSTCGRLIFPQSLEVSVLFLLYFFRVPERNQIPTSNPIINTVNLSQLRLLRNLSRIERHQLIKHALGNSNSCTNLHWPNGLTNRPLKPLEQLSITIPYTT